MYKALKREKIRKFKLRNILRIRELHKTGSVCPKESINQAKT